MLFIPKLNFKKKIFQLSASLLLPFIFITGCSKVNFVSVKVMEPALIAIPVHIKSVAIVDRSLPPKPIEKLVSGVLVGEDIHRNQSESQKALSGMVNTLNQSSRLEVKMTNRKLPGSQLGGSLPEPFPMDTILKLCKEYNTDGVIAMESFTFNTAFNTAEKAVRLVENGINNGVFSTIKKTVEAASTVNNEESDIITVKLGFRFYDGTNESIFDQQVLTQIYNKQLKQLVNYGYNANETSYFAGKQYAKRIVPYYTWVNRSYYKRPKKASMKRATRMVIVGDWNGALELWHLMEKDLSRKKAGRVSYNIALGYEVLGNLEQALFWCKKAKMTYKNKLAENYLTVLEERIVQQKAIHN